MVSNQEFVHGSRLQILRYLLEQLAIPHGAVDQA